MTVIYRPGLPLSVQSNLVRRVYDNFPNEACGFIMNSADPGTEAFIIEVPNISKRPEHNFQMDPGHQSLVYADEDNIFGMWHTHPHGPDGPSETDLKFRPPGLRCFVVTMNGVYEYENGDTA